MTSSNRDKQVQKAMEYNDRLARSLARAAAPTHEHVAYLMREEDRKLREKRIRRHR